MRRRLVPALVAGGLLLIGLAPAPTAGAAPAPSSSTGLAVTDRQVERHAGRDYVELAERLSDGSVQVRRITRYGTSTEDLGGKIRGAPAILQPISDRIATQVFARGVDDRLWVNERRFDDSWSGWRRIGGVVTGQPGVSRGPTGEGFDVYVRGGDGAVWHLRSTSTRGYDRPWARVGGRLAAGTGPSPTAARNGWDVVVRGTDGGVWVSSWTWTTGRWSGFTRLGGRVTDSPGSGFAEQTVVVARGVDGAAWLRTRSTGWVSLGGRIVGSPTLASQLGDNSVRVYATGTGGGLYTGRYNTVRQVWTGWRRTG